MASDGGARHLAIDSSLASVLISRHRRAVVRTFALLGILIAACDRSEPSPAGHDPASTPTADEPCARDEDCVFASGCCTGCSFFSGRTASARMRSASEQASEDRKCWLRGWFEDCPHVDCASPPPCRLDLGPACVEGRCRPRATGVVGDANDRCRADACGEPPAFTGSDCDDFAQAAYERCACLDGGGPCPPEIWRGLCADASRCVGDSPGVAVTRATADCP